MSRKTSEYYEGRIANSTWRQYNDIEKQSRAILSMYRKAATKISAEIFEIEKTLCRDGFLDEKLLDRYGRLKKIKASFGDTLGDLEKSTRKQFLKSLTQGMKKTYENIVGELNIDLNLPNLRVFEEMAKEPWRGEDFSSRLWKNKEQLFKNLEDVLVSGIAQGMSITNMALKLDDLINGGFQNVHRLVRTETMHYLNAASLQAYKDSGVQYVQFWAALDERTCHSCGALHGRIFPIDKVPVLPIHANCRCCYLPVTDKNILEKQLKIGHNGGNAVTNATALTRLENYAVSKYGINNANLSGLDAKAVVKSFRQLENLLLEYPKLKGYINRMELSRSGIMSAGPTKNFNQIKLTYNPDFFSDKKVLDNYYKTAIAQQYHPTGTTSDQMIVHEFGHVVESYLIKDKITGVKNRANAWRQCLLAEKIVRDAASTIPGGNLAKLRNEISNYATTTFSETIAEAFSDYYANGSKAKILSQKIIEEIQKWI